MRLFWVIANVENVVEVKVGRTFHQDWQSVLTHEKLLAVVRVRHEDNLAVVTHGANYADVIIIVVVVVSVTEGPFEDAFVRRFAEDFSVLTNHLFQSSVLTLEVFGSLSWMREPPGDAFLANGGRLRQGHDESENKDSCRIHFDFFVERFFSGD